jgi:hypothetical protein
MGRPDSRRVWGIDRGGNWWGADMGVKMDATFQDGKLIQKTQSGLK